MDLIQLADRMEHVHSDIRGELFHLANKMQREGTPVLKLNTGNPAAFGFPLPESIRNAIEEVKKAFYAVSEKLYQQANPQGGAGCDPNCGGCGDDGVVDADYETVD